MAYQDEEEQELPDFDEASRVFFNHIMSSSAKCGAIVVEHSTCPVCGNPNTHAHRWAESLGCMNPQCGKRYPSNVARPSVPGEPTADHFRKALEAMHDAQVLQMRKGLTKPVQAEIDALPEGTRLLLARDRLASVREMVIKVITVAEQLASL